MEIVLATDHAGFELKELIKKYLVDLDYKVKDFGAFEYEGSDDYPDFIAPASKYISENSDIMGIIFGGSGQGEAISANRFKNIRAAVYYGGPIELIKLSRIHNNANILSLGARFLSLGEAKKVINLWLNTDFEGGRHLNRINKIDELS
ncbi:MAG: RpiB/LacA/LacB family sugar-phosphate isomerase [Candidatus Marinimicrobia bacterium]|nr:RpiB/LacA/LacB family sugar-phosphate isomerase [Candidatus Neomarinimicrobiota bacterium]